MNTVDMVPATDMDMLYDIDRMDKNKYYFLV
jgi:hypothetical protein